MTTASSTALDTTFYDSIPFTWSDFLRVACIPHQLEACSPFLAYVPSSAESRRRFPSYASTSIVRTQPGDPGAVQDAPGSRRFSELK